MLPPQALSIVAETIPKLQFRMTHFFIFTIQIRLTKPLIIKSWRYGKCTEKWAKNITQRAVTLLLFVYFRWV